jgi:hypothetical protein
MMATRIGAMKCGRGADIQFRMRLNGMSGEELIDQSTNAQFILPKRQTNKAPFFVRRLQIMS